MLVSLSLLAIPSASVMIALHLKLSTSKSVIVLLSEFIVLFVSVFVLDTVGTTTHSTANTQAELLLSVVSEACHSSTLQTHRAVEVEATNPDIGNPVALVSVAEDGVHKAPLNVTKAQALHTFIPNAVATHVQGVMPAQVVRFALYACISVPIISQRVVLTCDGVLLAQALATETIKLSVVAVSPAIVVRLEFSACFAFNCV